MDSAGRSKSITPIKDEMFSKDKRERKAVCSPVPSSGTEKGLPPLYASPGIASAAVTRQSSAPPAMFRTSLPSRDTRAAEARALATPEPAAEGLDGPEGPEDGDDRPRSPRRRGPLVVFIPESGCGADPRSFCWYRWASEILLKAGYDTCLEPMPRAHADITWVKAITALIEQRSRSLPNGSPGSRRVRVVLVGHGVGAAVALRAVETHSVQGVVLIAPSHTDQGHPARRESNLYTKLWRWERYPTHTNFAAVIASDVERVPYEEARFICENYKGCNLITDPEGGQFYSPTFKRLIAVISNFVPPPSLHQDEDFPPRLKGYPTSPPPKTSPGFSFKKTKTGWIKSDKERAADKKKLEEYKARKAAKAAAAAAETLAEKERQSAHRKKMMMEKKLIADRLEIERKERDRLRKEEEIRKEEEQKERERVKVMSVNEAIQQRQTELTAKFQKDIEEMKRKHELETARLQAEQDAVKAAHLAKREEILSNYDPHKQRVWKKHSSRSAQDLPSLAKAPPVQKRSQSLGSTMNETLRGGGVRSLRDAQHRVLVANKIKGGGRGAAAAGGGAGGSRGLKSGALPPLPSHVTNDPDSVTISAGDMTMDSEAGGDSKPDAAVVSHPVPASADKPPSSSRKHSLTRADIAKAKHGTAGRKAAQDARASSSPSPPPRVVSPPPVPQSSSPPQSTSPPPQSASPPPQSPSPPPQSPSPPPQSASPPPTPVSPPPVISDSPPALAASPKPRSSSPSLAGEGAAEDAVKPPGGEEQDQDEAAPEEAKPEVEPEVTLTFKKHPFNMTVMTPERFEVEVLCNGVLDETVMGMCKLSLVVATASRTPCDDAWLKGSSAKVVKGVATFEEVTAIRAVPEGIYQLVATLGNVSAETAAVCIQSLPPATNMVKVMIALKNLKREYLADNKDAIFGLLRDDLAKAASVKRYNVQINKLLATGKMGSIFDADVYGEADVDVEIACTKLKKIFNTKEGLFETPALNRMPKGAFLDARNPGCTLVKDPSNAEIIQLPFDHMPRKDLARGSSTSSILTTRSAVSTVMAMNSMQRFPGSANLPPVPQSPRSSTQGGSEQYARERRHMSRSMSLISSVEELTEAAILAPQQGMSRRMSVAAGDSGMIMASRASTAGTVGTASSVNTPTGTQVAVNTHTHALTQYETQSRKWYCTNSSPACTRSKKVKSRYRGPPNPRFSCRDCDYDLCGQCIAYFAASERADSVNESLVGSDDGLAAFDVSQVEVQ